MPDGKYKSRSNRRVFTKTPGGRTVLHYTRRKPKAATCAVTGETLKGVPRARPVKMMNMAKTKKRPQRPFGGVLSSRAARVVLKKKARQPLN
jgi:large subunit ribosomal protein L34e